MSIGGFRVCLGGDDGVFIFLVMVNGMVILEMAMVLDGDSDVDDDDDYSDYCMVIMMVMDGMIVFMVMLIVWLW